MGLVEFEQIHLIYIEKKNSQSLENMQVEYTSQKHTVEKYTLGEYTLARKK